MKSDCTHRLNKREASKADIVVSLSDVMATKVTDFRTGADHAGNVLLAGGTTQNRHFIRRLSERNPGIRS
jgi:activator of 2-hydroxyglutaryl-CoA dehydratase